MNSKAARLQNIRINRIIIVGLIVVSTLQYFWQPDGIGWVLDILLRTYILFLCGVMGHEASHGIVGKLLPLYERPLLL